MLLRLTLPLLAVLPLLQPARAQSTTIPAALDTRLPEVTFNEAPFEEALAWLAEQSGVTIHVRWERLEEFDIVRDKPVSLKARNLPLSQVFWLLMSQAAGSDIQLAYRASGKLLVLSTEEDLGREMVTRVYDIRDLLDRAPRFTNATRIDAASALQPQGGTNALTSADETGEDDDASDEDPAGAAFVDLITEAVEPNSWAQNGGRGRIVFWRGRIVVYNSLLVHERLAGPVEE